METSQNIQDIAAALVAAQSEMGNALKGSANPFFKSKYADLNAVREAVIPSLTKHGISVIQPTITRDGRNYVKTVLLHTSGQYISGETEILYKEKDNPQAQGSGITYARRYGLQSICNIGAEDDDGNQAAMPSPKKADPIPSTYQNWAAGAASAPAQKYDDSHLPWLSDAQFAKALERIKAGEQLMPSLNKEYRIKRAFREQLEAASQTK